MQLTEGNFKQLFTIIIHIISDNFQKILQICKDYNNNSDPMCDKIGNKVCKLCCGLQVWQI